MVVSTFAMEQNNMARWLFTFKVMYVIVETQKYTVASVDQSHAYLS